MADDRFLYTGSKTNEISFPLGGIGTGCIGLAGNGRLVDWEIFNKPNKNSVNGFSHFAIKAERKGEPLDARVLNGDLHPPYSGSGPAAFGSFGFGVRREYLTGMPHFREAEFRGEFPIASVAFKDRAFPGRVSLSAFNPFIPLNEKDSGLPAAFFEFEIQNTTKQPIDYTLAATLANPLAPNNLNTLRQVGGASALYMTSDSVRADSTAYGDLTLATDAKETSAQQYWFRGAWFDNIEVYWRDLTTWGPLKNRVYEAAPSSAPIARAQDHGTLAAHVRVAPGKTGRVRFVIAWNFPNCENYWSQKPCECKPGERPMPKTWKNYYATLWQDSTASAAYALEHWDRLRAATQLFKDTLFASDLPDAALDAVSANLSILKSPTVLRLEDGTFYGWEGCHPSAGCCEGSCTHVWNYAQALPFLFPRLERSMREADYGYNLREDGGMAFRLQLPLGSGRSAFRPCADGQFGGVMKVYRDWKICGDTAWLERLWPAVRRSIEFAWSPENEDRWDPEKTGVLHGRQHHTLDMELFGPNSWLSGFYLGALKAGAEMAEALGETETANEYRKLFEKGKAWVDACLFNGEYYMQRIDLRDKSILERFESGSKSISGGALDAYWDEEHGEIKYQLGEGSALDQVLAQWHASLHGLGEIFDPKQVKKALRAIYKHNFRKSMREHPNPCRVFSLNDEAGLLICAYPADRPKPAIPVPYAQETMHGFEYAAAISMIQNGLVRQGMKAVEAVRAHYDGEKRNPWNEIECGSNYARSMASYALLNAFSGFRFDMTGAGEIGFDPIETREGVFRCFWSLDGAWGEFELRPAWAEVRVLRGELRIGSLLFPFTEKRPVADVALDATRLEWSAELERPERIVLAERIAIAQGGNLRVNLSRA